MYLLWFLYGIILKNKIQNNTNKYYFQYNKTWWTTEPNRDKRYSRIKDSRCSTAQI